GPRAADVAGHGQRGGVADRVRRGLRDRDAALAPVEHRRGEQVHGQRGAVVEVDGVHQLRVDLYAGALTAPEAVVVGAPGAAAPRRAHATTAARLQRGEVGDAPVAVGRVLRPDDVVEQCALEEVEVRHVV